MVGRQRAEFAPPAPRRRRFENCSACSLTGRPKARAPRRRRARSRRARRRCVSQKPSTASTSPSAASVGSIASATKRDIAGAIMLELGRQRVRAEESGADRHVALPGEAPRGAQHLSFRFKIEAVARLDLDRRRRLRRSERRAAAATDAAIRPRSPRASPRRWRRCRRPRARSLRSSRLASRSSNSRARFPAWTRWVWQSISAGVIQRPSQSTTWPRLSVAGRSVSASAKTMRPSTAATAPRSMTPRPGAFAAQVARRAPRHSVVVDCASPAIARPRSLFPRLRH